MCCSSVHLIDLSQSGPIPSFILIAYKVHWLPHHVCNFWWTPQLEKKPTVVAFHYRILSPKGSVTESFNFNGIFTSKLNLISYQIGSVTFLFVVSPKLGVSMLNPNKEVAHKCSNLNRAEVTIPWDHCVSYQRWVQRSISSISNGRIETSRRCTELGAGTTLNTTCANTTATVYQHNTSTLPASASPLIRGLNTESVT